MTLRKYQIKKKFNKTPEPKGKVEQDNLFRFVVHEHSAQHYHFDFRLELDGVLKSWAVPKGIPKEAKIKRLAVEVEDHPVSYIDFTGIIPKGQYGAGEVKIFDKGNFRLISRTNSQIEFELMGEKIKGNYILIKTKMGNDLNSWLIFKK
ncbi:MAG: 3'-phosphoesterase [Candidatus Berkelbacteria bacterium]|nr:3'-phosphoesterase [Candidatus Berkelbacteria bacterium]